MVSSQLQIKLGTVLYHFFFFFFKESCISTRACARLQVDTSVTQAHVFDSLLDPELIPLRNCGLCEYKVITFPFLLMGLNSNDTEMK